MIRDFPICHTTRHDRFSWPQTPTERGSLSKLPVSLTLSYHHNCHLCFCGEVLIYPGISIICGEMNICHLSIVFIYLFCSDRGHPTAKVAWTSKCCSFFYAHILSHSVEAMQTPPQHPTGMSFKISYVLIPTGLIANWGFTIPDSSSHLGSYCPFLCSGHCWGHSC